MGLFAANLIPQEESILAIDGELVATDSLSDAFISAGHWQGIRPGWCLIRTTRPTLFSLINHGKNPNARVDLQRLVVVANRLIQPGEEILLDYDLEPMDVRCRKLLGQLIP
jgi:hypothetical protein